MNNLYSSPKKVYTHYITLLFYLNWIWRRSLKFATFCPLRALPLAPMYHMITFESPALEDDSCQVWLKSNLAFLQEVDGTVSFLHKGLLPNLLPPRGPLGPPWELPQTFFILHLRRYLHFTYLDLFYLNWIWRRSLKFAKFLPFEALPPGPPWEPNVPYEQLWIPGP